MLPPEDFFPRPTSGSGSLQEGNCTRVREPLVSCFECSSVGAVWGGVRRRSPGVWPSSVFLSYCCLVAKFCLTLSDPMDGSPPGSSVHGISQARILEWVAISYSRGSSPVQGLNLNLLHWQADSLPLSYLGSPRPSLDSCKMFSMEPAVVVL